MPDKPLHAVVIGAGWAGEGHARALQYCGVDVVAICGRQAAPVQKVAARLDIPLASIDWRQTLSTLKPDIVALTTPASLRDEVVEVAVALGCHILCEKPLAVNATNARRLYDLVEQAGVKHAYAATHRYDPGVVWLTELVRDHAIGQLYEVELVVRFQGEIELTPWTWWDSLESGGGALNGGLTHILGMLETMTGSKVVKASGEAQPLRQRAPFVPNLHDYRERSNVTPTREEADALEWRDCDADHVFSVLLTCALPAPNAPAIRAYVHVNWMAGSVAPNNGWYLYGNRGTLFGDNFRSFQVYEYKAGTTERELLPVPSHILAAEPQAGDSTQNRWAALAQDFVCDIQGETYQPYLTFHDGWRYQEVIDATREGRTWCA